MSSTSGSSGSGNPSGKSKQIGAILASAGLSPSAPSTAPGPITTPPPASTPVPASGAAANLDLETRTHLGGNPNVTLTSGGAVSTKVPPVPLADLGPDSITLNGQVHCNPVWLNKMDDVHRAQLIAALNTGNAAALKPFCSSNGLRMRMRTTDQIEAGNKYLADGFTALGGDFGPIWAAASYSEQARAFDVFNSKAYNSPAHRLTQAIDFATHMGATSIGGLVSYMEFFKSKCEAREKELKDEKTLTQHCWKTVEEFLKNPGSPYKARLDATVAALIEGEINRAYSAAEQTNIAADPKTCPDASALKPIGAAIAAAMPADKVGAFLLATVKLGKVGKGTRKTFGRDAGAQVDGEMQEGAGAAVKTATKDAMKAEFDAVLAEVQKVGTGMAALSPPIDTDPELAAAISGQQGAMTFSSEPSFTYHVIKHHDELSSAEGGGTTAAEKVTEYITAARARLKTGFAQYPSSLTQGGARKLFFKDALTAIIVVVGPNAFFATFYNM